MARGLQLITSAHLDVDDSSSNTDLILIQDNPLETGNETADAGQSQSFHNNNNSGGDQYVTESTDFSSSSSYVSFLPLPRREPTLEETRAVGQVLFTQFCRQHMPATVPLEIVDDEIPSEVPEDINRTMHNAAHLNGYTQPTLAAFGRDLRKIAEQFEKSKERQDIKRKAEQVDLDGIRYDDFKGLLRNFFSDGCISRSRIIVLFCFCSDLALRAFVTGAGRMCCQLFTWSVAFIMESVCNWVQSQGGWGVVLGDYIPRFAITACALFGCVAFAIYIRRNLWSTSLS